MAERPKSAAEIAELNGLLTDTDLEDTATVVEVRQQVEHLRSDIYKINTRLGWIVSSVRSVFHATDTSKLEITAEQLEQFQATLDELNSKALKIGDILVADHDKN